MPANLSTEQSTYSTCQLSLIDVFTMNQSFSSCIQPVDPFIRLVVVNCRLWEDWSKHKKIFVNDYCTALSALRCTRFSLAFSFFPVILVEKWWSTIKGGSGPPIKCLFCGWFFFFLLDKEENAVRIVSIISNSEVTGHKLKQTLSDFIYKREKAKKALVLNHGLTVINHKFFNP